MLSNRKTGFSPFGIYTQIAFWLILLSFVFYLSVIVFNSRAGLQRGILVIVSHIVNFYVCYGVLIPRYFDRKKYAQTFVGLAILLIALSTIRYFTDNYIITHASHPFVQIFTQRAKFLFILFTDIVVSAVSLLLRLAVGNQVNKQKVDALERLHLETELQFLKAQINPHFLFNTINNIYSLTLVKSDLAPDALMKLSGLLRYMLYECQDKVPLQKELDTLKSYIELYQLRFEEPLSISLDMTVKNDSVPIEPLLFIPLTENALKHSGMGISNDAQISILLKEEDGHLIFNLKNSKPALPINYDAGGIGLVNIRKRLQMVYQDRQELKITEDGNSFNVNLIIPTA